MLSYAHAIVEIERPEGLYSVEVKLGLTQYRSLNSQGQMQDREHTFVEWKDCVLFPRHSERNYDVSLTAACPVSEAELIHLALQQPDLEWVPA